MPRLTPLAASEESEVVIPSLLLVGLVLGRWWRLVLPLAALAWPAWLVADGIASGMPFIVGSGLLAFANTGVGVLLNRLAATGFKRPAIQEATRR